MICSVCMVCYCVSVYCVIMYCVIVLLYVLYCCVIVFTGIKHTTDHIGVLVEVLHNSRHTFESCVCGTVPVVVANQLFTMEFSVRFYLFGK